MYNSFYFHQIILTMDRRTIQQLKGLGQLSFHNNSMSSLPTLTVSQSLFNKAQVEQLQQALREQHNYGITKASLPILSLYFQYFTLLKKVITQKEIKKKKKNHFIQDLHHYYAEEKVSQLLHQITNKNKEFKRGSMVYKQQCLLKYFQFDKIELKKDKLVKHLFDKIVKAKAEGNIKYQVKRSRKRQPTIFPMIEKDNKVRRFQYFSTAQTRKNMMDIQNQVHYQILTLKVLLKNQNPDPQETNKICEDIKCQLQNLFNSIKLKKIERPLQIAGKGSNIRG